VHLVAPAVVRLVRTLAHEVSPMVVRGGHAGGGQIARWRQTALVESWSMRRRLRPAPPTHAPVERPREPTRAERGHAAPVDTG
jgi:hypothetical protein